MKLLVTGGTGYIGSHTTVELLNAGHEIVIVDNLINSKKSVLGRIKQITGKQPIFYKVDLLDEPGLEKVFEKYDFDAVLHFAGLKAVGESVERPLKYYHNNLVGTILLLEKMQKYNIKKIIFSSSATVYGDQGVGLLDETMTTGVNITNPYGWTKFMIEQILKDFCATDNFRSACLLRYFNPIGAHPTGLIGENPNGRPNNLMPIIMKVSLGQIKQLEIYGDDYPTPDGSCVRDYIHVVDLARGHLAALDRAPAGLTIYNLGTGLGTSVFEMINAFEEASGKPLPKKIVARRPGDLAELLANPAKANQELGWEAKFSVEDAIQDTLNFLKNA